MTTDTRRTHRWQHRASFGDDYWQCPCGAICDHETPCGRHDPCRRAACHCGRPVHVYNDPGMQGFTRDLCLECSTVRCDVAPGSCVIAVATPGQERRAEAPTTSAPQVSSQHDPGRASYGEP